MRAKSVGDDPPRLAIFLDDTLQKIERCGFVPLRGDHGFQNRAFVIDSPPQVAELAVDLHKHSSRAKPVRPKSDGLMADVDPALGQEIPDIAQRQWVSHVHHYDQTDHFWRAVEIPERVAHGPDVSLAQTPRAFRLTKPDTVLITAPAPSRTIDNKFFPASSAFDHRRRFDFLVSPPTRLGPTRAEKRTLGLG